MGQPSSGPKNHEGVHLDFVNNNNVYDGQLNQPVENKPILHRIKNFIS
jgi:hypothetical protein